MIMWSEEWPSCEGTYWFYGRTFEGEDDRSYLVRVIDIGGRLLFSFEGAEMVEGKDLVVGRWTIADIPMPEGDGE